MKTVIENNIGNKLRTIFQLRYDEALLQHSIEQMAFVVEEWVTRVRHIILNVSLLCRHSRTFIPPEIVSYIVWCVLSSSYAEETDCYGTGMMYAPGLKRYWMFWPWHELTLQTHRFLESENEGEAEKEYSASAAVGVVKRGGAVDATFNFRAVNPDFLLIVKIGEPSDDVTVFVRVHSSHMCVLAPLWWTDEKEKTVASRSMLHFAFVMLIVYGNDKRFVPDIATLEIRLRDKSISADISKEAYDSAGVPEEYRRAW
jgi:hypothetical protein